MRISISKLLDLKTIRRVLSIIGALLLVCPTLSCQNTGTTPSELQIDFLGISHTFQLDGKGRLKSEAELSSEDSKISLTIKKGTKFVAENGKTVYSVQCVIGPSLSLPLQEAQLLGTVYNFSPEGITCNPRLELTMNYDPKALSTEFIEEEIYIVSYEVYSCKCGGAYVWYGADNNQVNPGSHKVSAQIETLDNYLLIAAKKEMVVIHTPTIVPK